MDIDLDWLMREFCETGQRALSRYLEISGESVETAPEYFATAFIANLLGGRVDSRGNEISVTLETTFSTLWKWNVDAHDRIGLAIPIELAELGEALGTQKVDMALFAGPAGSPKWDHEFVALVEFKKGNLETPNRDGKTDRDKLLHVLKCVRRCKLGIVAGFIKSEFYKDQKERAVKLNDKWFPTTVPIGEDEYIFCARSFVGNA